MRKAFIVGVSTKGLRYCKQDADLIKKCLNKFEYEVIEPESFNRLKVIERFEEIIKNCKSSSDIILIYFAGHAITPKGYLEFFLSEDNDNTINLNDEIAKKLCEVKCNKLIILDCCNAGAICKGWNFSPSERYIILTASNIGEQAREIDELKAGFFTHKIHEALTYYLREISDSENNIQVNRLYNWLLERTRIYNSNPPLAKVLPEPRRFGESTVDFSLATVKPELLPQQPAKFNFSFKNRTSELEIILSPAYNSIIIDAAAGYGKTALLLEVEKKCREEKILCYYIDFNKKIEIKMEKFFELIIDNDPLHQVTSQDTCLLFDAVEQLEDDEIKWLKNFLSTCREGIIFKLKVILAGRYISAKFQSAGFKSLSLSDFDASIVYQFIAEVWKEKSGGQPIQVEPSTRWVKHILDLSAGHPKCIEVLVNELQRNNFLTRFFSGKERELFATHIQPEIDKILSLSNDDIRQNIEYLFIFRRFNLDTLKELIDKRLIVKRDVFDAMRELSLIARRDDDALGFHSDNILRKLLLVRMRLFEPQRYHKLNEEAQSIYDKWINKHLPLSFGDSQILGEFFLKESIYHATQRLSREFQEDDLVQCMRQSHSALAEKLGENKDDPVCRRRLENILEDTEIHETLKEKLDNYDNFVKRLFETA